MKSVDLSSLKSNDFEYEQLTLLAGERYNCDWNDEVHDSYWAFIQQVNKTASCIRDIRLKAEMILNEVDALEVDKMIEEANSLCQEAKQI